MASEVSFFFKLLNAPLPKLLAVVIKSNYSTETAYFDMVCYLKGEASSGPISFVAQQTPCLKLIMIEEKQSYKMH